MEKPPSTSATAERKHKMQHGAPGDLVLGNRLVVVHLLAGENQPLLLWRNSLFFFHALLHSAYQIRRLYVDLKLCDGKREKQRTKPKKESEGISNGGQSPKKGQEPRGP
eukprot:m.171342 g.171342  ORF g.171342 m.171342 type:complete len:109 (-) comp53267_c0_seq1:2059-2385(-)